MTTTERAPAARPITASQLRSYLVALLAGAYLLAWWRLGAPAFLVSEPLPTTSPVTELAPPRSTVWLTDLPPSSRPPVSVPAGWHVVDRAEPASVRSAPAPIRVSAARRGRVRTRSS